MFLLVWILIMSVLVFLVHVLGILAVVRVRVVILLRVSRAAALASTARGRVSHVLIWATVLIHIMIVRELSAHAPGPFVMGVERVSTWLRVRVAVLLVSFVLVPVIRVLMFLLVWILIMSVLVFLVHVLGILAVVRVRVVILRLVSRAVALASTARGLATPVLM
jgi:hypothetical protein